MKKKTLLTSLLTIVMCLALIAGSTYALFTSEDKINIAVTSGKIEVIATINNNSIATTSLGVAQTPGEFANGGTAVFATNEEGEKVLTLDKMTPGDSVSFTITVENKSTVAMNYRFVWSVEGDLAQYLKATVDGAALVNNATPYTAWTGENTKTLTVVVTLPDTVGKEARDLDADISFTVEAIQGNVTVVDGIVYSADENGNMVINSTLGTLPEKVTILQGTVALPSEQLSGHTTVKEVVIPAGLIDFGGTANAEGTGASGGFFKKSSVEKVTLPEGLTEIPAAAFNQAANLKEVNIPTTVKSIGINAFAGTGLETLTIPATVENIAYGAFRDMANLTTVVIEGKATIANYAFRSCKNLESVYILGDDVTFLTGGQIFTKNDAGDAKNGVINVYVVNETVKERLLAVTSYDAALNVVVLETPVANGLYETSDGNYVITTPEGFLKIRDMIANNADFTNKTISLASNLDMNGATWTTISKAHFEFGAKLAGMIFDGNGYTISNMNISGSGLFDLFCINGTVTFKNLTMDNITSNEEPVYGGNQFKGVFAGNLYSDMVFDNVTVSNSKIGGYWAIGAFVGIAGNENAVSVAFNNCHVKNFTVDAPWNYYNAAFVGCLGDNSNITFTGANAVINFTVNAHDGAGNNTGGAIHTDVSEMENVTVDGYVVNFK